MRCFRHRSRQLATAATLLALLLPACLRRQSAPPATPAPSAAAQIDAPAVVATVNARAAQVRTLRARFTATVVDDGRERALTGALIVAARDRYRFRLMLPFGMTVFDLVRDRATVAVLAPLGRPPSGVGPELLSGWMLTPPHIDPGCQMGRQEGMLNVWCGGFVMLIRPADGTIAATWGGTFWTRYSDERPVDGVLLPHRIDIPYSATTAVRVVVESYEINPSLSDDLFVPPPGATVTHPYADVYEF